LRHHHGAALQEGAHPGHCPFDQQRLFAGCRECTRRRTRRPGGTVSVKGARRSQAARMQGARSVTGGDGVGGREHGSSSSDRRQRDGQRSSDRHGGGRVGRRGSCGSGLWRWSGWRSCRRRWSGWRRRWWRCHHSGFDLLHATIYRNHVSAALRLPHKTRKKHSPKRNVKQAVVGCRLAARTQPNLRPVLT